MPKLLNRYVENRKLNNKVTVHSLRPLILVSYPIPFHFSIPLNSEFLSSSSLHTPPPLPPTAPSAPLLL